MALTFRSTTEKELNLFDRDEDGRQRLVTARRDPSSGSLERWRLEVRHPSGWSRPAVFTGNQMGAVVAMGSLLEETRQQFRDERYRGDQQPVQLDPMRGAPPLPSAPVISMKVK